MQQCVENILLVCMIPGVRDGSVEDVLFVCVVGNNLGTRMTTPVASGEFVGLKMMPSLKASSFTTRALPVYTAPLTHLTK